ncbi:MAG: hypothetical protein RLZZ628_4074 [Bacteroidota bacterium]|jgi:hypothetical protein
MDEFINVFKYHAIKHNILLSSVTTLLGILSGKEIILWGGAITTLLAGIGAALSVRKDYYESEVAKFDYISKKRRFNLDEFQIKDGK